MKLSTLRSVKRPEVNIGFPSFLLAVSIIFMDLPRRHSLTL